MSVKFITKFSNDRDGAIAIIFALTLIPAIAVVGSAIDYARALSVQTRLQSVTDIAAQAGARLPATANANRMQAALDSFNVNIAGASITTVVPTIEASNSGVTVTATTSVPTAFMGLVGFSNIDVEARASARSQIQNGGVVCLLALSPSSIDGLHMQGVNKVSSPDCWAWINSTASTSINATGAASGVAQGFCTAGHIDGSEHFKPSPHAGCDPMDDPFYEKISKHWVPTSCTHTNLQLKSGIHTLTPGVYCGNTILKPQATVTMQPGLYVMKDGYLQVQAGASVTGNGVTLFFSGQNTKMEVRGGGSLDLKAPTTGDLAGFVIVDRKLDWYDPSIRDTVIQGGGRLKIEGILYAPQWKVNISGNGEINQEAEFFTMIADSFYMEGNGKLNISSNASAAGFPDLMPKIATGPVMQQ